MNCCPIKSHTIQNICEQYDLINLIKEVTGHQGHTPSLLEVILVFNSRRYASAFNVFCGLNDFHDIIGAATKRFGSSQKPWIIHYKSFKSLQSLNYNTILLAHHSMWWRSSTILMTWHGKQAHLFEVLLTDEHAPMKSNVVKSNTLPFMNSALRKATNGLCSETNQEIRETLLGRKSPHKKSCRWY